MAHPMPFVVGVTGGVGSGKSTAASCLKKHGAVVVDADEISRTLTTNGSPVIAELSEAFGSQILHADGSLNRPVLAALVFGNPEALKDLNAIMHPRIRQEAMRQIQLHSVMSWWWSILIPRNKSNGSLRIAE